MEEKLQVLAAKRLESELYDKSGAIYSQLMEDWDMPTFVEAPNKTVISKIAHHQALCGVEDFSDEYQDVTEDTLSDSIKEFVEENYDNDFLTNCIERELDTDKITTDLKDDILLFLANTDPFVNVPDNFWKPYVDKVSDFKELAKYDSEDGVYTFVEKYAADWEEVAKENLE